MSQANVEAVRQAAGGDMEPRRSSPRISSTSTDDVVVRAAEGWPETAYQRKARGAVLLRGLCGKPSVHDTVIEDLRDAGEAVVFVEH